MLPVEFPAASAAPVPSMAPSASSIRTELEIHQGGRTLRPRPGCRPRHGETAQGWIYVKAGTRDPGLGIGKTENEETGMRDQGPELETENFFLS